MGRKGCDGEKGRRRVGGRGVMGKKGWRRRGGRKGRLVEGANWKTRKKGWKRRSKLEAGQFWLPTCMLQLSQTLPYF